MARIESLNMLLDTTGKDYLAESYGKVIENIEKTAISAQLKNRDLSGTPESGSVEAKRFVNAESNEYGTARTGRAGVAIKVKPVIIQIDNDREIIEEIEEKDVSLCGVDSVVSRRVSNHARAMTRELERAFFDEALQEGNEVNFTAATDIAKLEEIIQKVETVQNDFVDGVPRDMISVVLSTSEYSKIRSYLDAGNANVDTSAAEFSIYHGVRVYSSVYLPEGCSHIAMCEGAIAQPVLPKVYNAKPIELSNAIGFGIFYYYGTKVVMPDLVFFAGDFATGLNDLTVTSAAGAAVGDTKVTVSPAKARTNHYVYKTADTVTMPSAYDDVSEWNAWNGAADITATTGNEIAIVEANKYDKAIKGGKATVVAKS